ncbi:hypothetical protein ACW5R3_02795 [Bizionia sp. KMM 8389]
MKIKNWVVTILILFVLGCGSVDLKPKSFVCLDEAKVESIMKGYELIIPESWCSFYGLDNILLHSPILEKDLELNYSRGFVYVNAYDIESYKNKNIEESIAPYLSSLKENGNPNPSYDSDYHPLYGKYYLIKNSQVHNDVTYYTLEVLFNYQNQDYIINYQSKQDYFDTYLPEVLQIITTFKIKED